MRVRVKSGRMGCIGEDEDEDEDEAAVVENGAEVEASMLYVRRAVVRCDSAAHAYDAGGRCSVE